MKNHRRRASRDAAAGISRWTLAVCVAVFGVTMACDSADTNEPPAIEPAAAAPIELVATEPAADAAESVAVEPGADPIELVAVEPGALEGDAEIEAMLAPFAEEVAPLKAPIGNVSESMEQSRSRSSALVCWVADVMRANATEVTGVDVDGAFMNSAGVRSSIAQGPVSIFTMMNVLPFDNNIVVFTLGGAQMLELGQVFIDRKAYFAVSGMTLAADGEGKLSEFLVGGKPVDPAGSYRIATVDYIANGGDNMDILATYPTPHDTGSLLREAAIAFIKSRDAAGEEIRPPTDPERYHFADQGEEQ